MTQTHLPVFDPWSESFRENPFKAYEDLRARGDVFENPDGSWVITSYEVCARLLKDRKRLRRYPDRSLLAFPEGRFRDYNLYTMPFMDPPDHPRVRNSVAAVFTPRALASMETAVRAACDELIGELAQQETFDFAKDFAGPFPLYVICRMLGVPLDERELFRHGADAVTAGLEPAASAEVLAAAASACEDLAATLEVYVAERRGSNGTDIISLLLSQEAATDLSHDELINQLIFLLLAGHETTATLLNMGMKLLMEDLALAQRLRDDPSLIAVAVEEFLRLHPSLHFIKYYAAEAIEVGDVVIPADSEIVFLLASANRDPLQFPDPDAVDVTRTNATRQLAFSVGPHTCLGNNLARMEARVAFQEILTKMPKLRIDGEPVQNSKIVFQGLESLPVRQHEREPAM